MGYLTEQEEKVLEEKACAVRQTIIEMLTEAKSGHTAGSLGMTDIFVALYFHTMKHDPKNPTWEDRDRAFLSNGHIVPVQYATMAHAGYFPVEECMTLRKFGTRLQGHPERTKLPGLETTSGPLGSGLSQAGGMAYAARMDGKKNHFYCLMSDAEQQAGNIWEGAMFAGANKLSNITGIVDNNNIQITGKTQDIMPIEPFKDKYESFGWHVIDIDGHNMEEITDALQEAKSITERPTLINAHTIPGKGVAEIEGDYLWHGKPPKPEECDRFLTAIREACGHNH